VWEHFGIERGVARVLSERELTRRSLRSCKLTLQAGEYAKQVELADAARLWLDASCRKDSSWSWSSESSIDDKMRVCV
jgi:hypothetical protein